MPGTAANVIATVGEIARSIGRKGPALLFLLGVACLAFEWFVIRERMEQLSALGRRQIGEVVASTPASLNPQRGRLLVKPGSVIEVHDPEIGAQLIEQPGRRPIGARVPVLCATTLFRCAVEEEVRQHLSRYPVTVLNFAGAGMLALAVGWLWALRRACVASLRRAF